MIYQDDFTKGLRDNFYGKNTLLSGTEYFDPGEESYCPGRLIPFTKCGLIPPEETPYNQFTLFKYTKTEACCYYHCKVLDEKYMKPRLKYLWDNQREFLQEKLDNGTLYMYIRRFEKKVEQAIDCQVKKWAENDREILAAKQTGNILEEAGLMNNLTERAEEIINSSMIYV